MFNFRRRGCVEGACQQQQRVLAPAAASHSLLTLQDFGVRTLCLLLNLSELLGCKMRITVRAVWEYCRHWACDSLWSLDGRSCVYFKAKISYLGNAMDFTLQLCKCKVSLLSCK